MPKSGMKRCTKCQAVKLLAEFYKHPINGDGKQSWCKRCHTKDTTERSKKNPHYKRNRCYAAETMYKRYRMSAVEYDSVFQEQGGVCAICSEVCNTGNRLSIDHDHKTGFFRGLLCIRCNAALGHMRDNTEYLARAIEYIEHAKARASKVGSV